MELLDEKLALARGDREQLLKQYEQLLIQVEGMKSTINASESAISGLEQQKLSLQAKNQELMAFRHPIRRLPNEIIRHIFELAVLSCPDNWYQAATALAHVCQKWRRIALGTSVLWSHVTCRDIRDEEEIYIWEQKFDYYASRMGSKPPVIEFRQLDDAFTTPHTIGSSKLDRFDAIQSLQFQFKEWTTGQILKPGLGYSAGPLRRLSIISNTVSQAPESTFSRLLKNFPTAEHLEIDGLSIEFEGADLNDYSSLRSLKIDNGTWDRGVVALFTPDLSHLTGLQTLVVNSNTRFRGNLLLPNLRACTIQTASFDWTALTAPQLVNLAFSHPSPAVFAFIERHTSILHIDATLLSDPNHIAAFSTSLRPRVSLKLRDQGAHFVNWSEVEAISQSLTHLTIEMERGRHMSTTDFEKLVKGLIPSLQSLDEPRQKQGYPVKIDIIGTEEYFKYAPWRNSNLLNHFKQTRDHTASKGSYDCKLELRLHSY